MGARTIYRARPQRQVRALKLMRKESRIPAAARCVTVIQDMRDKRIVAVAIDRNTAVDWLTRKAEPELAEHCELIDCAIEV